MGWQYPFLPRRTKLPRRNGRLWLSALQVGAAQADAWAGPYHMRSDGRVIADRNHETCHVFWYCCVITLSMSLSKIASWL